MKRCPGCQRVTEDFARNARRRDGLQSECRSCRKQRDQDRWEKDGPTILAGRSTPVALRRRQAARHGLTVQELEALIERYGGLCWACRLEPGAVVDHCHRTERRRGWLCNPCNKGLGHFGDDPARLRAAIAYLLALAGASL